MSVAHGAGWFGPAGFPRLTGPSGPSWWRRVRRHPGVVTAVAVVAAVAVPAGITVAMTAGASHRPQASGPGLGAGVPAPASSATPGATSAAPSPARTAPASAGPASARPTAPAISPATLPAGAAGAAGAGPSPGGGPAAPSTSPSPSASSAPGYLLVKPVRLVLTSVSGKPVSGSFVLTAADGPVPYYTVGVVVMTGRVKVAPMSGSLPVDGNVRVTVTVTSKAALTAHVVVEPGNLTVTVVYKIKPQPSPSPLAG